MTHPPRRRPERATIDVPTPDGGWPDPWPTVSEIAAALPTQHWTLVGGLMTQLHAIHRGLPILRPTNDVDIVLHIETTRGVPAKTAKALRAIGFELEETFDPRNNTAHRFIRRSAGRTDQVDITGAPADTEFPLEDPPQEQIVDVLVSDHHAPRVSERMLGRDLIPIEGGTQALRRTLNARVQTPSGEAEVLSVPDAVGALILKAAAAKTDSRDPERHLDDAVALLACVRDPYGATDSFQGSDRSRILYLHQTLLPDDAPRHRAWLSLDSYPEAQRNAQDALTLLARP